MDMMGKQMGDIPQWSLEMWLSDHSSKNTDMGPNGSFPPNTIILSLLYDYSTFPICNTDNSQAEALALACRANPLKRVSL